jgi:hypothetical protein
VTAFPANPWRTYDRLDPLLNRALLQGAALPALAIDNPALQRALASKIDLWKSRDALINQAVAAKVRLRLPHPSTGEASDVTKADAKGLDLTAANGANSTLAWHAIPAPELARVLGEAAITPGLPPTLVATAAAGQVILGETIPATLTLRRAKNIPAELRTDLELLLAAHGRHARSGALEAAEVGWQMKSARPLDEALALLTAPGAAAIPGTDSDIAWAEAMRAGLKATTTADPAKDLLTFDTPADLASFPGATGVWNQEAGALRNAGAASLARTDLSDGSSVVVIFRPQVAVGALTVEFRGARAILDLAANRLTLVAQGRENTPQPAVVPPGAASTLMLEYRAATASVVATLNGGVTSGEIALGNALTSRFAVAVDSGASIALDEIGLTRDRNLTGDKATLRLLGWESQGAVTLDGPAIHLAGLPDGVRGGLTTKLRAQLVGYTFDAKGSGGITLGFGRGRNTSDTWEEFTIPLPGDATLSARYAITWGDGLYLVKDGTGAVLLREPCPVAPTVFGIKATDTAVLLSTPRPTLR